MSGWVDSFELSILNWFFTGGANVATANTHLALFTTTPLADDGSDAIANETTYPGYARVTIASTGANWEHQPTTVDPTALQNVNVIQFEKCTGPAPGQTIQHWGLMDNPTAGAGSLIFHGVVAVPLVMAENVQPQFDAGALKLRLGG